MEHAELVAAVLSRIDSAGLQRVNEQYPDSTWSKFFNVGEFVDAAAAHALRFHRTLPPGSNCIDVGCGFGYVALALECLGHFCVAWDNDVPLIRDISAKVPVREWWFKKIIRGGDYTDPGPYDLIFLHGVFPLRDARGWWAENDYAEFIAGLTAGLAPGGRLEILVNRGDQLPVATNAAIYCPRPGRKNDIAWRISDNSVTAIRDGVQCDAC